MKNKEGNWQLEQSQLASQLLKAGVIKLTQISALESGDLRTTTTHFKFNYKESAAREEVSETWHNHEDARLMNRDLIDNA